MSRRVLLISHEPEAAPAMIGEILLERGFQVDQHIVLADPAEPNTRYPDPHSYEAIMAFGSFANAYDERARPWVDAEIDFIRGLLADDIPYLGLCFGGQLLAETLGGHVERAPAGQDEVGLVQFDPGLPIPSGPWFTWHEDRVVLPAEVDVLARNANAIQLFRKGRAIGTQFHPEANVAVVSDWIAIGPDHIPDRTSAEHLIGDLIANSEVLRANCEALVDWFFEEVSGDRAR
jgi:GMP synthase-like glutamine amidotransferase